MNSENNSPPKPKKKVTFFRKPIKPRLKSELKDFQEYKPQETNFNDEWNIEEEKSINIKDMEDDQSNVLQLS
jgi:hypothetical protein